MAPLYQHGSFSSLIGAQEKHRNLPRSGTPTGAPLYLRHLPTEPGQERDDSKSCFFLSASKYTRRIRISISLTVIIELTFHEKSAQLLLVIPLLAALPLVHFAVI